MSRGIGKDFTTPKGDPSKNLLYALLKPQLIVPTECGHGFRVMRWEAENWLSRSLPCSVRSIPDHNSCNLARNGGVIEEPRGR